MMAIAFHEILITLYLIKQCHNQNITASTASDSSHLTSISFTGALFL